MKIENIKTKLEEVLSNYEIVIYSIKTKFEFGEHILEILLKGKNLTSDLLAEVHQQLYDKLEDGDIDENYFLELSSVGAEYDLESLQDVIDHIDGYVTIQTNKYKAIGTILSVEDTIITLKYNDKGQFRKLKIEYDEILKIRTSVKI